MPIYQYECRSCGNFFERIMKIGEAALACPACAEGGTQKLVASSRTNAWSTLLDGMEKRVSPEKFR